MYLYITKSVIVKTIRKRQKRRTTETFESLSPLYLRPDTLLLGPSGRALRGSTRGAALAGLGAGRRAGPGAPPQRDEDRGARRQSRRRLERGRGLLAEAAAGARKCNSGGRFRECGTSVIGGRPRRAPA